MRIQKAEDIARPPKINSSVIVPALHTFYPKTDRIAGTLDGDFFR
jgi:hypothetical protein